MTLLLLLGAPPVSLAFASNQSTPSPQPAATPPPQLIQVSHSFSSRMSYISTRIDLLGSDSSASAPVTVGYGPCAHVEGGPSVVQGTNFDCSRPIQEANITNSKNQVVAYQYEGYYGLQTFRANAPIFTFTDLFGNQSVKATTVVLGTPFGWAVPLSVTTVSVSKGLFDYGEYLGPASCGTVQVAFNPESWKANFTIVSWTGDCGPEPSANIAWVGTSGGGNYVSLDGRTLTSINSTATPTFTPIDATSAATQLYAFSKPGGNHIIVQIGGWGSLEADVGSVSIRILNTDWHAWVVVFPAGVASVDPTMEQDSSNSCGEFVESCTVSLPSNVTAGDTVVTAFTGGFPNFCPSFTVSGSSLSWVSEGGVCIGYNTYMGAYIEAATESGGGPLSVTWSYSCDLCEVTVTVVEVSGVTVPGATGSTGGADVTSTCVGGSCGRGGTGHIVYSPASFGTGSVYFSSGAFLFAAFEGGDPPTSGFTLYANTEYATAGISSPTTFQMSSSGGYEVIAGVEFPAPVTQPISIAFSSIYGGAAQIVTISGCSPSPSSVGLGTTNVAMGPNCSFTLSLPGGYQWTTGNSGTTCSSGACSTFSATYEASPISQSISCSMADGSIPQATLTLSGDNVSPNTIPCDGNQHSFSAGASSTVALTIPADGSTSRYRFKGDASSISISICSSGNCPVASITVYYQYSQSAAYSLNCATGATCSAPSLYYTQAGVAASSVLSTSVQVYWVDSDTTISASTSVTDSLGNTYTPALSYWFASGPNVVNSPIKYWEGF